MGMRRACLKESRPVPVMLATVSENQTGLSSLVGANRTVAQPYNSRVPSFVNAVSVAMPSGLSLLGNCNPMMELGY